MTATVAAARLKESAAWANQSIAGRPSSPIMGAAVLEIASGELAALGWDGDDLTRMTVTASGELPRTLVSGRLLTEVTARLEGEARLTLDGSRLLVEAGRNSFRLPVMPPEQYPATPADVEMAGTSADFAALVDRVAPSASHNPELPIAGVALVARGGRLSAGAFNGYLLSYSDMPWDGDDFEANPLGRRLHDAIKPMGEKVSVGIGHVLAVSDGSRYASMLVHDVPGADYQKAIMAPLWDDNGFVDVDRAELGKALSDVRPMLGEVRTVRVAFEAGEIVVRANAGDLGDATSAVAAHLDGEARTYAINGEYLGMALDGLDHEVVRIHFGPSTKKPVQVTGVLDGAPDYSTRHMIQPIRVND